MLTIFSFLSIAQILNIALLLFLLGFWGIFVMRHNIIIMLMCIEIILLSTTILFVTFSVIFR